MTRTLATALALFLTATACGTTVSSGMRIRGGVATFAEAPGAQPSYIFPLTSLKYFNPANVAQFSELMYRPLYWFGQGGTVKLNPALSLAAPPQYSADGRTVTIKMKSGWKWSDGAPITSRDLEFWMNLLEANKASWAGYSPGEFPDNVTAMSFPDAQTAVFTLDRQYGSLFFTYNELSQITPLPQHAWDKTSDTQPVGDYDRNAAAATRIYNYLDAQARSLQSYATNPLWQVVDGPWKLKRFGTDGFADFVPNKGYSGPVKPTLSEFREMPYAEEKSELAKLRAGGVDYGYVPYQDVGQRGYLGNRGYRFEPWAGWQIAYIPINFTNPASGPIFRQLYLRQALQHLVDQSGMIHAALGGFGRADYGPVPPAAPSASSNPYPFDVGAAKKLLRSHGWTVVPEGATTCAGQCGAGIAAGTKLSLAVEYAADNPVLKTEAGILVSDFAKAGIQLAAIAKPFDVVVADAAPCAAGSPCNWDLAYWGVGWTYAPDYYPTGDEIFASTAASNGGGYSDPRADDLIASTTSSSSVQAMSQYEDYLAKNLPVMWMPTPYLQLSEVRTTLQGTEPQDPLGQLTPERWFLTRP